MTRLFLVRHGQTQWNVDKRTQGSTDTNLTEKGIWQAEKVSIRLENENITKVYTSDLKRAYQTAREISERLKIELKNLISYISPVLNTY